jgi:hypothetical protein
MLALGHVLRPGQDGNNFKTDAPHAGESVVAKRKNSAFIGTDLEPVRAKG